MSMVIFSIVVAFILLIGGLAAWYYKRRHHNNNKGRYGETFLKTKKSATKEEVIATVNKNDDSAPLSMSIDS
jgi:hypothetical protein